MEEFGHGLTWSCMMGHNIGHNVIHSQVCSNNFEVADKNQVFLRRTDNKVA